jgi:uncharacterized membrane protein
MATAAPAPAQAAASRLPAIDWMRGIVMVLMTVDHASDHFNAGRLMTDSAFMYTPGAPLPTGQFLTRWVTHLCAPTFVFLAGTALALSVEKRRAKGEPARALDRFIVTRGLVIAALDPIWMSWALARPGVVLLQVLYAIGLSLVCMAPLRRLSTRAMLGVSLGLIAGGELLAGIASQASGGRPSIPAALLFTGGRFPPVLIAYPLVHWLALMMLGWAFGRALSEGRIRAERWLAASGAGALALFVVLRWLNGYGNMRLFRGDDSAVQWLHVSKYPPSITYHALELGLMALCLAALFALARRGVEALWLRPLLVLGQTALFFYVLHVHVLLAASHALGAHKKGGLMETWVAAGAAVLVLYPLCVWYRRYKLAHPDGWARYL